MCRQSRTALYRVFGILPFQCTWSNLFLPHWNAAQGNDAPDLPQQGCNIQLSQHLFFFIDQCSPGKWPIKGSIPQLFNSRPIEVLLIRAFAHIVSQHCFYICHYSLFHLCASRVIAEVALCAKTVSQPMLKLQSWFMLIGKLWSELSRRWDARLYHQAWGPFPEEIYFNIPFSLMDQLLLAHDHSKNQSPQGVRCNSKHSLSWSFTPPPPLRKSNLHTAPFREQDWHDRLLSTCDLVLQTAPAMEQVHRATHCRLRQKQHVHSLLISKRGRGILLVCHEVSMKH